MQTLTLQAPAKINLTLRILGRRDDGFHDLETVFQAVGLHDTVQVTPAADPGVHLEVEGAELGPASKNLVWRGAMAFLQWSGMQGFGARIRLVKRIPVGAGLGGGSSDAAAALKGLSAVFGHPLAPERLLPLAAALGSDVPFFMGRAGRALGRGRGERLTPLPPLPDAWVVVGMPSVPLSTAEMYERLATARDMAGGVVPEPTLDEGVPADWEAMARVSVNDFEPIALEAADGVAQGLAALGAGAPILARLSGSGAAVFAVHADQGAAEAAAAVAREAAPEVTFDVVPTLSAIPGPGAP